jgi:pimeloyl-ACP methyl ester carboxylesterase
MADLQTQLALVRARHPLEQVTIDGHTWPYVAAGCGDDVLLLLPGAMGEADTSFQYILALQDQHRVLSLSYPATIDSLVLLLGGLRHVLAALAITQAHVVGGSFSGLVAQYLAHCHPACVASLLLSNIGAPDPADAARWRLAAHILSTLPEALVHAVMRAAIRGFLPNASVTQLFWRNYFAATIPALGKQAMVARLLLAAEMHAGAERLRRSPYRGSVLALDAGNDALVPIRQRQALRSLYPQAHHVVIAGKGHVASLDEADVYIAIYREFLCGAAG